MSSLSTFTESGSGSLDGLHKTSWNSLMKDLVVVDDAPTLSFAVSDLEQIFFVLPPRTSWFRPLSPLGCLWLTVIDLRGLCKVPLLFWSFVYAWITRFRYSDPLLNLLVNLESCCSSFKCFPRGHLHEFLGLRATGAFSMWAWVQDVAFVLISCQCLTLTDSMAEGWYSALINRSRLRGGPG